MQGTTWSARCGLRRRVDEALAEDSNPPEWERRVILPAQRFKVELP